MRGSSMAKLALLAGMAATLAVLLCVNLTFQGRQKLGRTALEQAVSHGKARTEVLWDNYWPGYRSVRARYARVKEIIEKRNKEFGQKASWDPTGHKNLADPVRFCKDSFPPESFFHQEEFHSCLEAIGAKKVDLDVGDSQIVTDITGAPAGRHQPDGPDSLSPGSDGWSRN